MSEDWTCYKCGAENKKESESCTGCGLHKDHTLAHDLSKELSKRTGELTQAQTEVQNSRELLVRLRDQTREMVSAHREHRTFGFEKIIEASNEADDHLFRYTDGRLGGGCKIELHRHG